MFVLEIENLEKSYLSPDGKANTIIDIPHFSLKKGEQKALTGSSGSGKTTFLNLIAGILKADKGCIKLAGKEMNQASESARDALRASHIGYVFQTFNLLPAYTALENVLLGMFFGGKTDEAFARELLERLEMGAHLKYRPSQLSVGQQQRVALARALANKPSLVLADEPTGNLDFQNAGRALDLIRKLCLENGTALLLVSHDEKIISCFDDVEKLSEINKTIQSEV